MPPAAETPHLKAMDDLALYIHWPFCVKKCPYCDFNSHVREQVDQAAWADALRRELAYEAARLGRRRLTSIFFGGGTPSLMAPSTVAALIADARAHFTAADEIEITLEANPGSVEASRFEAYAQAGVNRVSVGVQALDDAALRALGRQHDARQAVAALEIARTHFPRVSFDLIYARPGQTVAAWRDELARALELSAAHLSLYQLTIEPGTAYEAPFRAGSLVLPDEPTQIALYEATAEEAGKFGLRGYEISNYARPGQESRHNLAYWRYADYAGIGPGAHGRVTVDGVRRATRRHRAPEIWLARSIMDGHGTTHDDLVPDADAATEALLMGLRLTEGIVDAWFCARTGRSLMQTIDAARVADAMSEGLLTWDGVRLAATDAGRMRLDALLGWIAA